MKTIFYAIFTLFFSCSVYADQAMDEYMARESRRETLFTKDTESLKEKYRSQFQSLEALGEEPPQPDTASAESSDSTNTEPAPLPEENGGAAAPQGRFSTKQNLDMSLKDAAAEAQKRRDGKK